MIETTSYYHEKLYKALSNRKHIEKPQLVSVTTKLDSVDSLGFFQAGKVYQGERVYWTSADTTFTLVGVGSAYTFEADRNRFFSTRQMWNDLLGDAVVLNPYEIPGTGPVALGGFSFDPLKEGDGTWEDFPNSKVFIPMYLLTEWGEDTYLTLNLMIHPNDNEEELYNIVTKEYQNLISGRYKEEERVEVTGQEEILPAEFKQIVSKATDHIKTDQIGKVVLAREMVVSFSDDRKAASVVRKLKEEQTQSYIFAFESGDSCFVGATPERLVKVENNELLSTCLAGTVPRGKTPSEDEALGEALLNDEKNLQEHDFVVQMIKEAVTGCCENVHVPDAPVLYPLRNLQHLYTPVSGTLKDGVSLLDVVERLHPTPALGGYPREDSLQFIREYEPFHRGWYASPVGWFDSYQNGEFAVAIRSALLKKDEAVLFSGCGVVEDSDPEEEYQETAVKFLPMIHALGGKE
ncbi:MULTISPECIES: isochorismate synthase [Pontibacillus]|uniref:Isochorismate synthase MenF n=1 Tax=Pontibacillus chungwhensis TaxID=265426 RepID=A0ABY8UVJ3_9BACI|nr:MULTISPECIES: isochorismate synthase [Pontibacillus]MCD5325105.1 isochorismate synthase [Pontibacillus sp. HN14]WIF97355.1 isochorismate synthase [Pontibacillus chungwhensis]